MDQVVVRRRRPFLVAAVLIVVVCGVVIGLPDSFLTQLERNRPFTDSQAGWAYRLLAFFAAAQLIYAGYSIFSIERVSQAREQDPRFAALTKPQVIASLARNAAALVIFTLVYGVASVLITGLRGGFWLFPLLAVAQAAWYYREIGQIASWSTHQPDTDSSRAQRGVWQREGPDYCPPIARGLKVIETTQTPAE